MVKFLLGIIFLTIALPLFEQIGAIISMGCEVIKASLSLIISKINSKIQEYQQPESKHNAIGFQVEEEYDDDEFL